MTTGKRRLLVIVTIAGLAALLLAGANEFIFAPKAGYVRIESSGKSVIYLRFQADELRAATSVKGLKSAKPINLVTDAPGMMPDEFRLPFPDDQFPGQVIKGTFQRLAHYNDVKCGTAMLEPPGDFKGAENWIYGLFRVFPMGDGNTAWAFWVHVRSPLGNDPDHAPLIQLPAFNHLKLTVQAAYSEGKLGIGLRVHAGSVELGTIEKGEHKNATAQIRLLDEAGVELASKTDQMPLLGFG